jgi:hypothetical protein
MEPQQNTFVSTWLATEDDKVIVAKYDVESKHSLVE